MTLHAAARTELRAWEPPSEPQGGLRDASLAYIADHEDGVWRTSAPAHLTASAVILDPIERALLLVLHGKVKRWLQPGGHCELGYTSLGAAALREAVEESGISTLGRVPGILHLDRHPAPCNPGVVEEHLDVRSLMLAAPGSMAAISPESIDVRWFAWDALPVGIETTIIDMLGQPVTGFHCGSGDACCGFLAQSMPVWRVVHQSAMRQMPTCSVSESLERSCSSFSYCGCSASSADNTAAWIPIRCLDSIANRSAGGASRARCP